MEAEKGEGDERESERERAEGARRWREEWRRRHGQEAKGKKEGEGDEGRPGELRERKGKKEEGRGEEELRFRDATPVVVRFRVVTIWKSLP